ncbi:BCD family MFS transporter [Trichothermofontia sp.]
MTSKLPDKSPIESSSPVPADVKLPTLGVITMLRLGLFQMGLGMMSLLTLGVLNRIMIAELRIPAVVAASTIAVHQFMAPARVWFGQLSDAKPFLGYHRTGYIWVGALCFVTAAFLALQVSWQLGNSLAIQGWSLQTYGLVGLLAVIFGIYGLALSASSTPFAALLVDVSEENNRSKLVGIVWSMLMVGIIIGAIISSILLKQLEIDAAIATVQASVNRLFSIILVVVLGLIAVGTIGIENTFSRFQSRSSIANREDSITLGRALQVLTASRQTALFFTFLLIMTISLFMQEPILEPYAAKVFEMPLAETTRLNAFWGLGTLIGLSTTGFLVVPRLGKQQTTRLGCFAVSGCFVLILLAGFTHEANLLLAALLLFGLASGITTTGAISMMLDLTIAETAGTFIGAWGLSQAIARGMATVMGGSVQTLVEQWLPAPLFSYGAVFVLQALGMLLAVGFLQRVNVQEFRQNAQQAIATILESELD